MVSVPRLSRRFNLSVVHREEFAPPPRRPSDREPTQRDKVSWYRSGCLLEPLAAQTSVSHSENAKFKLDIHNRRQGSAHFVNPTGVTVTAGTRYGYERI